jgi:phosphate transport system substrate-binding protein
MAAKMKKYLRKNELMSLIVMIAVTAVFMVTCRNQGTPAIKETPTSGDIRIVADESFQPIIDAEVATFTSLYKYASITPVYKPEKEMIADFLNDSVKVIVTSWTPTEENKQLLLDALTVIRTTTVAYDALALVMHKSNYDSLLTYDEVESIFKGKITDWKQINPSSKLGRINIVFDNDRSGNIRYFREKFDLPDTLPDNFFAVNNNPEVIEYVSESPDALGIVSVNWISDRDDSLSVSFINKVKVAGISMQYLDKSTFYLPVQGSIYEKTYPFVRGINMVSRESFSGLGSGFITWTAGEQGQRIILKSGLVPATMPIRLIQVKNE